MFFTTPPRAGFALLGLLAALFAVFFGLSHFSQPPRAPRPFIAIANFGPHPSLNATIQGLKDGLARQGFSPDAVLFEEKHVNFDAALIPQMIAHLGARNPDVLVALTTPVAQFAAQYQSKKQGAPPLVFSAITDPLAAGLLQDPSKAQPGLTGTSDQQDFDALMTFIQKLRPEARQIGVLYGAGEANDVAFVRLISAAAQRAGYTLVAVPVDHGRDIPLRIGALKDVDLIYVGVSGTVQPALPAIVAAADRMGIPVINTDADAVAHHHVLASFGAAPYQVGVRTAECVARLLRGEKAGDIAPIYPSAADHHMTVSRPRAAALGIDIPADTTLQIAE